MRKKGFHTRSFVSFSLLLLTFWLLISGTVIFIAPPGRIAHWQSWTLIGFDKDQWQAQHTISSYMFIGFAVIHLFLINWRNFWSYIKLKSKSRFRKRKEFVIASALFLSVIIGTAVEFPPLISVFNLGDEAGMLWENEELRGPISYTENLSLVEITKRFLDMSIDDVLQTLSENKIEVQDPDSLLKDVAKKNGVSPAYIFSLLQKR